MSVYTGAATAGRYQGEGEGEEGALPEAEGPGQDREDQDQREGRGVSDIQPDLTCRAACFAIY